MALGRKLAEASKDRGPRRGNKGSPKDWLHRVDIDHLFETLEILNVSKSTADEYSFSCPLPGHSHGDERPSAYMNDGSKDQDKATLWQCFGCGRKGSAITFYAEMENVSRTDATRHLREQYAPDFRAPIGGSISAEFETRMAERKKSTRRNPLPSIPWDTYEQKFGVEWQDVQDDDGPAAVYLLERGFARETLSTWRIGYDDHSDRLTIPVCDAQGNLVGVKARTWKTKREERIKYLILGDREGRRVRYGWNHYEKSRVLFGLHMAREMGTGPLILVEGELDVLALWQCGYRAVATGGAAISSVQAKLLRSSTNEAVSFFDAGAAGVKGTIEVVSALEPFMRIKIVGDHEGDPSSMVEVGDLDGLRNLIESAELSFRLQTEKNML